MAVSLLMAASLLMETPLDVIEHYEQESAPFDPLADFEVYPREWTQNPQFVDDEELPPAKTFTVVTYNLLGDRAIHPGTYTHIESRYRYMPCRHPRQMQELRAFNADIVCLQEVEAKHFHDNLAPDLRNLGYNCVFHERLDDLGMVTAYKSSKFELVERKHCLLSHLAETAIQASNLSADKRRAVRNTLHHHPHSMLLVKLRCLTSSDIISIGNIHTLWGALKYTGIQTVQIVSALNELVHFAGGADKPHMLVGDFNTPPTYPAYQMLQDGKLDNEAESFLRDEDTATEHGFLVDLLAGSFQHHSELSSAYKTVADYDPKVSSVGGLKPRSRKDAEPSITNLDDACQDDLFADCLDYLWYSQKSIDAVAVLETPSEEIVTKYYSLPSVLFPSDHLPLQAKFCFK